MTHEAAATIPRSNDALSDDHHEMGIELKLQIIMLFESLAVMFGESAGHISAKAFLLAINGLREADVRRFDGIGWRKYIDEEAEGAIDFVDHAAPSRAAAEYARQGISPHPNGETFDIADRERCIGDLNATGRAIMKRAKILVGEKTRRAWEGAFARYDFDFKRPLTLRQIHLLSGVSMPAIQNAVSAGKLPVRDGVVAADTSALWVAGRREFCPSRWRNLNDDQYPFDPDGIVRSRDGMVHVPRDKDTIFTPEHVVRPAKRGGGLSITIGAKGHEENYHDFYEALSTLAKMDVARWRRRDSTGNWGIVRARGAWIAVSKAEIDQQLADKLARV
jgi:hypothetical protein